MTETLTPTAPMSATLSGEYCDRCGAQAKTRIVLDNGHDLVFCGHHTNSYSPRLKNLGTASFIGEQHP